MMCCMIGPCNVSSKLLLCADVTPGTLAPLTWQRFPGAASLAQRLAVLCVACDAGAKKP